MSRIIHHREEEDQDNGNVADWESSTADSKSIASEDPTGRMQLAKSETKNVSRSRNLLLLVLFLAAVAVSGVVHYITRNAEKEEFETQFSESAAKLGFSVQRIVDEKLETVKSLATAFSAFVLSQPNMEWPFVTINNFQERVGPVRKLSNSLFVRLVPEVSLEQRREWETYSVNNLDWIRTMTPPRRLNNATTDEEEDTGRFDQFQTSMQDGVESVDYSSGWAGNIWEVGPNGTVPAQGSGPFFPLWQESPAFGIYSPINWDALDYAPYKNFIVKTMETGQMTMGAIQTAAPGGRADIDTTTRYFAHLLTVAAGKPVDYKGDPMSTVFVPVFREFNTTERPVAVLLAVFAWASYFENLLTANFPGVTLVLKNTCEGPFSYKIVGSQVEYLGPGDLHDTRFDYMVRNFQLASNSTLPFNQDLCSYDVDVYPTKELYDAHITSLPIFLTAATLLVFVIACGAFLVYNRFVEQRQEVVLNHAAQSSAIVDSLFPGEIRDRLMEDSGVFLSGKTRIKSFLNDGDDDVIDISKPIADLFPHVTVFICDISGFTAWSSTRDPAQVFVLLQTLYQAFDAIAKRRNVFKVESVGDRCVLLCRLLHVSLSLTHAT